MIDEILTWPHLITAIGVTAAIAALTQILKRRFARADPKLTALGLSLFITFGHRLYIGGVNAASLPLTLLNAIFFACAAAGAYESLIKPFVKMKKGV